jgi:hypothetical protein
MKLKSKCQKMFKDDDDESAKFVSFLSFSIEEDLKCCNL